MDSATTLEYSQDALESKSLFYGKSFSVFVEGDDDLIFWESLFKIAGYDNVHIEDVGGYLSLISYMEKITTNNAKILVAADTDHRDIIGYDFEHEQIIRTYGYSIENSMYSIQRLYQIIKKLSHNKTVSKSDLTQWRVEFSKEAKKLLILSIANMVYGKGEVVFGDKCNRFLTRNNASTLCTTRIDEYINNLRKKFTDEEIQNAENMVNASTKDLWYLIKGHFLTNGVLNQVSNAVEKTTGKKLRLPLDALYAMCVDNEELKDKTEEDITEMINRIKKAMQKIEE